MYVNLPWCRAPRHTRSWSRHRPAISGTEWIADGPADAAAFRYVRRPYLPTLLLASPHPLVRGRPTDKATRGGANSTADTPTLAPAHEAAHEAAHLAALAPTDRAAVVHPADPRAHICALGAPHHADGDQPADATADLEAVESPQRTGAPPRDFRWLTNPIYGYLSSSCSRRRDPAADRRSAPAAGRRPNRRRSPRASLPGNPLRNHRGNPRASPRASPPHRFPPFYPTRRSLVTHLPTRPAVPPWQPTRRPSHCPSRQPSAQPTSQPIGVPTRQPSSQVHYICCLYVSCSL